MIIGFYDADLMSAPKKPKVNLEIMKMASYFSSKNHVVELITDLDELQRYDKVYVRKESIKSFFPNELLLDRRVEWGGLGYTNNIHVPCTPIEIEYCKPNISIYNKFFKKAIRDKVITEKQYKSICNRNYFRLFLENELMGIDSLERNKPISLFDTNITQIPKWTEGISLLEDKTIHKIEFINPVVFTQIDGDFDFIINNPKIKKTSLKIILDIPFNRITFKQFIKRYEEPLKKLGDGSVKIVCGKNYYGEPGPGFFKNDFLETCNKICYGLSHGIEFSISIYSSGVSNPYEKPYNAINSWVGSHINKEYTLAQFLKQKRNTKTLEEFQLLAKDYPKQFAPVLNSAPSKIKKRGYWCYE